MAATTTAGTQEVALKGGAAAAAVVAAAEKRLADARAAAAAAAAEAPPPAALRDGPTLADRRAAAEESVATLTASLDALTKHLDAAERAAKAADAKASLLAELAAALSPYASAGAALRPEAAGDPVGAAAAAAALRAELAAADGGGGGGVRSVGDAAGAGGVLDAAADLLDARAREAGADLAAAFDTLLVVRSGGVSLHPGAAVADALASVGGLPTALASVADRFRAGRVAAALRAATAFFDTDAGGGEVRYEWVLPPKGAPPPAGRGGPPPPPLEWEPADREAAGAEVGVDDWAAMAAEPAVANACARALRLLDSTVTVVLGGGHARPAVDAWTGWALNDFFAPRAVLGRSPEGLARRVTAAAAASRVLETALGARRRKAADGGAAGSEKGGHSGEEEELTLAVQPGVLEAQIAGELRAQALLDARRSVSRFADAAAALAAGGGTSSALVPVPDAVARAHPDLVGCRYSASASGVRDVAARTVRAAVAATRSGSAVVGGALAAAAADAVAAPARDVPLQYGEELGGGAPPALRLAAVHYVDCRVLSAAAGALATAASPTVADAAGALGGAANTLSAAADAAVAAVVADATAAIRAGVSAAGGAAGDLGAYGTLAGLARSAGLRSAVTALRAPVGAWAGLAPPPAVRALAGVLGAAYLNALADATRGCPDISEAACDVLTGVLQDGLSAAAGVMECVPEGGAGGGGGAAAAAAFPPALAGGGAAYAAAVARAGAVVRVLNARMEDIIGAFRAGQYGDALSRADVEAYVTAIFEDSPLRAQFLADLDAPEEDGDDWGWK